MRAIRDNTDRTRFNGIDVFRCQLTAFVIAAAFAGLAGALLVPFNRAVSPGLLSWVKSSEPLMAVIIGGQYLFFGPVVGAAIFQFLQSFILEYTIYWPFIVGIIILFIILIMPQGVLGMLMGLKILRRGGDTETGAATGRTRDRE